MNTIKVRIGLDKAVLSNFRILNIDYDKLRQHTNVEIDVAGSFVYQADGVSFRWLKIKDNNKFGTLTAGVKKKKQGMYAFERMEIFVGDGEAGNLQNKTVDEYKSLVIEAFEYLSSEYGIVANYDDVHFSLMEINCTFPLESEFYQYHRALRLLMYNLPSNFKKLNQVQAVNKEEHRLEAETYYRGNNTTEVKIYDKRKQLAETIYYFHSENLMRIEVTLKKPQRIKEAFKTNSLNDFTDAMINDFYIKQFERLFVNKYKKWQKENAKRLKRMIVASKVDSPVRWKSKLLRECSSREQADQIPLLLDIEDLLDQIKELDTAGHFSRTEEGIRRQCIKEDVFLQKDSAKIEEIIQKVYAAYDYHKKVQAEDENMAS